MKKSTAKSPSTRRMAFIMYFEGFGFHAIGRVLNVCHLSVMNLIKKYRRQLDIIKNEQLVRIAEMDGMHSYVIHKTPVGYDLLLIERKKDT